jgi:hypothetical protein
MVQRTNTEDTMKNAAIAEDVELILDNAGHSALTQLIEAMMDVCGEKAEHLRTQDEASAKEWDYAAARLGTAWNAIAKKTHL